MATKLNPTPGLPFLNSAEAVMGWANGIVSALVRELSYNANRANVMLAGDGSEAATAPVLLKAYTVTTLPSASAYTAGIIYVSNGTANKRLAVSDGTNWRFPDGNIVS